MAQFSLQRVGGVPRAELPGRPERQGYSRQQMTVSGRREEPDALSVEEAQNRMTRLSGTNELFDIPDPNSAVSNYGRNVSTGTTGRPLSMEALRQSAAGLDRADHAKVMADVAKNRREGRIDTIGREQQDLMNKTALSFSPWTAFTQSLKNAGVGALQTGAARGLGMSYDYDPSSGETVGRTNPGFFDTQEEYRPSIYEPRNAQRERNIDALRTFHANTGAAFNQDRRRS